MAAEFLVECPECGETRALKVKPRGRTCKPCANRRNGHLNALKERPAAVERFHSFYEITDSGCWTWTGAITYRGYGVFHYEGRWSLAHRVSHVLFVGPIPPRLQIDHLCRNTACVNPQHLEAVTAKENTRRARAAKAQARNDRPEEH